MRAGSSQDIGQTPIKGFVVASSRPPVVEIDTEASAAYVRFGRGKVVRTKPFGDENSLVMVDYDGRGRVLGIEFVGQSEFGVFQLLKKLPIQMPKETLSRTRYVPAGVMA